MKFSQGVCNKQSIIKTAHKFCNSSAEYSLLVRKCKSRSRNARVIADSKVALFSMAHGVVFFHFVSVAYLGFSKGRQGLSAKGARIELP